MYTLLVTFKTTSKKKHFFVFKLVKMFFKTRNKFQVFVGAGRYKIKVYRTN